MTKNKRIDLYKLIPKGKMFPVLDDVQLGDILAVTPRVKHYWGSYGTKTMIISLKRPLERKAKELGASLVRVDDNVKGVTEFRFIKDEG